MDSQELFTNMIHSFSSSPISEEASHAAFKEVVSKPLSSSGLTGSGNDLDESKVLLVQALATTSQLFFYRKGSGQLNSSLVFDISELFNFGNQVYAATPETSLEFRLLRLSQSIQTENLSSIIRFLGELFAELKMSCQDIFVYLQASELLQEYRKNKTHERHGNYEAHLVDGKTCFEWFKEIVSVVTVDDEFATPQSIKASCFAIMDNIQDMDSSAA